jgi:hypothetical protein
MIPEIFKGLEGKIVELTILNPHYDAIGKLVRVDGDVIHLCPCAEVSCLCALEEEEEDGVESDAMRTVKSRLAEGKEGYVNWRYVVSISPSKYTADQLSLKK